MTTFEEPQAWWDRLSATTKERLLAQPLSEVPRDVLAEVVQAGAPVTGAWFTYTDEGPDKMSLPQSFEDFLEKQRPR